MAATLTYLFIGIGGHAIALDRATGTEIWRQRLGSKTYVTISFDGRSVFAGCNGEIFCLDPATGEPRWHNQLPGLGTGLISFGGATEPILAAEMEEVAAAAVTAGAAAAG